MEDPRATDISRGALAAALADAGGVSAPGERVGQLRALLLEELRAGAAELRLTRSGYRRAVAVAIGPGGPGLLAVVPVDPMLRADAASVREREWLLTAAVVGALVDVAAPARDRAGLGPAPARDRTGAPLLATAPAHTRAGNREIANALVAGELWGWLALGLPIGAVDATEAAELAPLAFEDHAATIDRLRACAYAVPAAVLEGVTDLREPIGTAHPLRVAEAVARLDGRPADEGSVSEHEELVLAALGTGAAVTRPHQELDPALRVARRILQRLAGMGKWGGYHTEFEHLPRRVRPPRTGAGDRDRGSADRFRAAGGEAERGAAPRLPEPAPRGGDLRADRSRRAAGRPDPALSARPAQPPGHRASRTRRRRPGPRLPAR